MIIPTQGNILSADAQALVNTVNCVGVMGKGLALQFKQAYPANYRYYRAMCNKQELKPGVLCTYDLGFMSSPRYIINFPTKRHWRDQSRIEDIKLGLQTLVSTVRQLHIDVIAVPPLGCGLGGLDFAVVRPLIEQAFESTPDIRVMLYAGSER